MNQVSLIGRITRDLELRDSTNGTKFVGFTLAVSEYRNGNEFTNFVPCIAWDKNAENMVKFLRKGSQVAVTGRISVRTNNADGKYETIVNVNADRVEFLDTVNSNQTQESRFVNQEANFDMNNINTQTASSNFNSNNESPTNSAPSQPQPQSNEKKEEDDVITDDSILWD